MSANTTRTATDRQGRRNDLTTVAEKIKRHNALMLRDIFDPTVVGVGTVHIALARYDISFLSRIADLYFLAELQPLIDLFDDQECNTWWEKNRRAAAAAVILYLREEANKVSRIRKRGSNGPWVFLGYSFRDIRVLRLGVLQAALPQELDLVVELWARKDDGFLEVWFDGERGPDCLQAAPSVDTSDRHLLEARRRYEAWRQSQPDYTMLEAGPGPCQHD